MEAVRDVRTARIIGAAIEVHRALGPGLLESAYASCLAVELADRRVSFDREVPLPILYKGAHVDAEYRLDFVVESAVAVELKSVEALHRLHVAQLLTYMRLGSYRTGLLLNFNVPSLREGIIRLAL